MVLATAVAPAQRRTHESTEPQAPAPVAVKDMREEKRLTLLRKRMSVVLARSAFVHTSRQSVIEYSCTAHDVSRRAESRKGDMGEGTHESVDFRVLLEREVERERGEEDDRLHVVKVRYPVLALL